MTKIVITGGPCAGKSTAMSWVQNAFTEKGYTVLFVPETATSLISGGVAPWTCGTNLDYQKCQFKLQMVKEELFEYAARSMNKDKILIVCDRGALDNKAYMTQDDFEEVLRYVHSSEVERRDSYDAVFHLVTAAKGAEQFYTKENNAARYESVEEAVDLDARLLACWTGHPHLRVIDNSTDFSEKMKRLISEISSFLGEAGPHEKTRKFLIKYPDIALLESLPNCRRVELLQTYLKSNFGERVSVQQRGGQGSFIYFQRTKRFLEDGKTVEMERRLTQNEYLRLLMNADDTMHPLRKTRYCMTFNTQCFEIDVLPFWKEQAIAQIKLTDEDAKIVFPEMLHVIREVTKDSSFRNSSLATR